MTDTQPTFNGRSRADHALILPATPRRPGSKATDGHTSVVFAESFDT